MAWRPLTGQLCSLTEDVSISGGPCLSEPHSHRAHQPATPLATGHGKAGPECCCSPPVHAHVHLPTDSPPPGPREADPCSVVLYPGTTGAPGHHHAKLGHLWPLTCMGACFKALSPDSEQNSGRGTPQGPGHWEQSPFVATDLSDRNARSQGVCCGVMCR